MKASSAAAKLNCLLIGDGSLLIQCGALLLAHGHHIAGVVTANDAIADWARENGAAVVAPGQGLADRLAGKTYDWLFSIANLSLVPAAVWQAATSGAANFHDGPLPRYAGLNTPAWAMLAGETQYGVTWHAMSDEVDEGDIHVQSTFDIDEDETALTLNTKCFEAGIASFAELIELIEAGALEGRAQDLSQRTYRGRHDRPDAAATLDFTATTADIDRVVRALDFGQGYVNPLALPKIRTQRGVYFVLALEKADATTRDPPGTVCASDEDGAVIATEDGAVRIKALVDAAGTSVDLGNGSTRRRERHPPHRRTAHRSSRLHGGNSQARSLVHQAPAGRACTGNLRLVASIQRRRAEYSIVSIAGAVRVDGAACNRGDCRILHPLGHGRSRSVSPMRTTRARPTCARSLDTSHRFFPLVVGCCGRRHGRRACPRGRC